jgi:curved DNA-binding protein CbpA
MNRVEDPYAVLGLTPQAAPEEIKKAYFSLVRAHPPERDPEGFKRIRAAYDLLRIPEQRRQTDMLQLAQWPEPELVGPDELELTVDREDVVRAARAYSDLGRRSWSEDCREVAL